MNNTYQLSDVPDAESILYRLGTGAFVDEQELERVAYTLESIAKDATALTTSIDDVYTYLLVLGRAKADKYRQLFERYLDCGDPFTVAFVLETLCLDWEQTETYFEYVLRYAVGVSWDEEEDVKLSAIKILGEYLRKVFKDWMSRDIPIDGILARLGKSDLDVVGLLASTFSDSMAEHWTRQGAYCAMCRAAGKEWSDLPSECMMLNLDCNSTDVDWGVVNLFMANNATIVKSI